MGIRVRPMHLLEVRAKEGTDDMIRGAVKAEAAISQGASQQCDR